jgi:hypothetical protein
MSDSMLTGDSLMMRVSHGNLIIENALLGLLQIDLLSLTELETVLVKDVVTRGTVVGHSTQ